MGNIIAVLLRTILLETIGTDIDDLSLSFNMGLDTLASHTLMIEKSVGSQLTAFDPQAILNYITGFAVVLIVLKFLKKGFDTWIAWTDDPTSDPLQLATNFVKALVCALTFPILYEWLVSVVEDFTKGVMDAMNIGDFMNFTEVLGNFINSAGLTLLIFLLIYIILIIVLYIKFLMRGAEIFIIRMGFPLACVGLIDANGGIFTGYLNKLFQAVLSVSVQVALCKLSLVMMIGNHLIWAIVFAITAVKSPKILSELIYTPAGGGGIISKAYYAAQMAKSIKTMIGK